MEQCPEVGHFFETLKSQRRLRLTEELNRGLLELMAQNGTGLLSTAAELKDFELYAGDGHWHGAAAHGKAVEGTKYAVGHLHVPAFEKGAH